MTETPAPSAILEILTGVAMLLDKVGDQECAVALLTVAVQHPASEQTIREEAQRVLARLQTEVAPEVFAAGVERGKALKLETVIAEFLDSPELLQLHQDANQMLPEPLTQREMEILQLIAAGLSNREIADRLVVTLATVKRHINNLYGKLGVASRTRAIVEARRLNLL
jgi:LuxR family maltose regulon positive regulatory protein